MVSWNGSVSASEPPVRNHAVMSLSDSAAISGNELPPIFSMVRPSGKSSGGTQ